MLRTVVLLSDFVETDICFQGTLMNLKFKEQYLFEIEMFCKMLNIFAVTFDQFNASLLNKFL